MELVLPWWMDDPSLLLLLAVCCFFVFNVSILRRLLSSRRQFGGRVRRLYNFNTIYLPLAMVALAAAELIPNPHDKTGWFCVFWALLGFTLRIYATHIEPKVLRVRKVYYPTSKVKQPFTILHISDFETDAVRAHEPRMFRYIRSIKPDLLIHTGDLLNPRLPGTYDAEFPKLCELFNSVTTPYGKLNVIGEVDGPVLDELLQNCGNMLTLFNAEHKIEIPEGVTISVLGLTLEQSSNENAVADRIEDWMTRCDDTHFTLLLGHRPDFVLTAMHHNIDLCLAGHTHGGQVRLPFLGALFTMSTVPRKLARGFHHVGKTRINVSAGVGFEHDGDVPAIRFNCPPEMTLIILQPT